MRPWQSARRVLCIRLDSMGDVLMTTPAIRAVREGAPGRRVTLLTSSGGAAAARLVPEIDEVIVYDAPWNKMTEPPASSDQDWAMIRQIRDARFDAAIIFTVYSQNPLPAALFCYLAGIPLRLAHCHENPYHLLSDWIRDPEPDQGIRHEVQRQLDLVAEVGYHTELQQLSLQIPAGARAQVHALLKANNLDVRQPWVPIHAGATAPSRRYPPQHFATVARALVRDYGIPVVFTGSPEEEELVQSIRDMMRAPSLSLVGQLDLGQLAALLERAPVVLSNNSGPAHVAAAVGTPVVDLYALTNPQHTPWGVPSRVLYQDVPCKFCYKSICPEGHHNCLRKVAPATVVQAVLSLLGPGLLGAFYDNQAVVEPRLRIDEYD